MGASVTGVEPQADNISAAVAHAQGDPLVASRTRYLAVTAEELAHSGIGTLQDSAFSCHLKLSVPSTARCQHQWHICTLLEGNLYCQATEDLISYLTLHIFSVIKAIEHAHLAQYR